MTCLARMLAVLALSPTRTAARSPLAVGKLADLAVLSKDYLSVLVEEITGVSSLLTMVGGRVAYAEGP